MTGSCRLRTGLAPLLVNGLRTMALWPLHLCQKICLLLGLFNLDHNPSSTTCFFISWDWHPKTKIYSGETRPPIIIPPFGGKRTTLPGYYSTVLSVALKPTSVVAPECNVVSNESSLDSAKNGGNTGALIMHYYF